MKVVLLATILCLLCSALATDCPHAKTNKQPPRCTQSSDCDRNYDCAVCPEYATETRCYHKSCFPDFGTWEGVGTAALVVCILFAATAGIGGGGLNVPIFLLAMNFDLATAKVLSHVTIFGNSLAQFIVNAPQRHGPRQVPTIDYNIALLVTPAFLAGHNVGIIIFPMFPQFLVLILLMALLLAGTYRSGKKGLAMYRKEQLDNGHGAYSPLQTSLTLNATDSRAPRDSGMPWRSLALLFLFWCIYGLYYFLAGGKESPSIIASVETCNVYYWLLFFALFPIVGLLSIYSARVLFHEYSDLIAVGYCFQANELQWNKRNLIRLTLVAFFIGLAAGLVGIGGGEFLSPVFLEVGMAPQVASATSAFVILVSTCSDVLHYLVLGQLDGPWDCAVWVLSVGLVAGLVGRYGSTYLASRHGRASFIVLVLSVALLICAVLAGQQGVQDIMADAKAGGKWYAFNVTHLCG